MAESTALLMTSSPRDPSIEELPPPSPPQKHGRWPELLDRLEVGQTIVATRLDESKLRAAVTRAHRRWRTRRFTVRIVDGGLKVRCWRTA